MGRRYEKPSLYGRTPQTESTRCHIQNNRKPKYQDVTTGLYPFISVGTAHRSRGKGLSTGRPLSRKRTAQRRRTPPGAQASRKQTQRAVFNTRFGLEANLAVALVLLRVPQHRNSRRPPEAVANNTHVLGSGTGAGPPAGLAGCHADPKSVGECAGIVR